MSEFHLLSLGKMYSVLGMCALIRFRRISQQLLQVIIRNLSDYFV